MRDLATEGPVLRRRRLGMRLRELRESLDMTGDQAGRAIGRSASWISRIEAGTTILQPRDLRLLLDAYGIRGRAEREEFEELIEPGRQHGWWSPYGIPPALGQLIGFEESASRIEAFQNNVIYGLLQTEAYARAIFRASVMNFSEREIEDRVTVRMRRQQVLQRDPHLRLTVILDQAVLNHVIGGPEVMASQLSHLARIANPPDLQILVIPYERAVSTPSNTPFNILRFSEAELTVVYTETVTGGNFERGEAATIYSRLFERLRTVAVDQPESLRLIKQALNSLAQKE